MKKIIPMLNIFVFCAATLAIIGVFYEGMALRWFPVVGILIIIMDFSFILSTIVNLIFYRKSKILLSFSLLSLILIVIAFVMKGMKIEYPIIGLVLWYFYIWFYYGVQLSKKSWNKMLNQ